VAPIWEGLKNKNNKPTTYKLDSYLLVGLCVDTYRKQGLVPPPPPPLCLALRTFVDDAKRALANLLAHTEALAHQ